jgi:hypothetical protein
MESPAPGDHILFWGDDSASSDSMIGAFVRGGLDRDDLLAVLWPSVERETLRGQCETAGVSLDEQIVRGNVILLSAEQYHPRDPRDANQIGSLLDQLAERVRAHSKSGLSFIGRLAALLFEQGDAVRAETLERMVEARRGTARVLCPYRSKQVDRLAGASALVRSHSHTITAIGRGRFLLESVGSRSRS